VIRVKFYTQTGSKPNSICLVTFHEEMRDSFFLLIAYRAKDGTLNASLAEGTSDWNRVVDNPPYEGFVSGNGWESQDLLPYLIVGISVGCAIVRNFLPLFYDIIA
jgi:hypothetical protein